MLHLKVLHDEKLVFAQEPLLIKFSFNIAKDDLVLDKAKASP